MLEFKTSDYMAEMPWGNGHTPETNPANAGWRCRPAWKDGPLLIGRKGQRGCASLVAIGKDEWDVALYCETPETIIAERCATQYVSRYFQTWRVGGYGLGIIRAILSEMEGHDSCG